MVVIILLCIALILVGAFEAKPGGWVVLSLALIALLLQVIWHTGVFPR